MHGFKDPEPWKWQDVISRFTLVEDFRRLLTYILKSRASWKNSFQLLKYLKHYKSQRDLIAPLHSMNEHNIFGNTTWCPFYRSRAATSAYDVSRTLWLTKLHIGKIFLTTSRSAKTTANLHTRHKHVGIPCNNLLLSVEITC